MLTVALTGGIGSGKSAVADMFAKLGVPIIDADIIARELVETDVDIHQKITQHFNLEQFDRAKLRELIFADVDEKRWLEALLHPRVITCIEDKVNALDAPYCMVVIPLLVEAGLVHNYDINAVVDVPVAMQIERTLLRDGCEESLVQAMIEQQASREERLKIADVVIDNSGTLEQTLVQVQKLHARWLAFTP